MNRQSVLSLFEKCEFNGELNEDNFDTIVFKCLPPDFQYDWDTGVSKLVISPVGASFVIKIPFNGAFHESGHSSYYITSDIDNYVENCFANGDTNHCWDYCLTEVLLYKAACRAHIQQAFAKTSFIGEVNNHPIYIQERVTPYGHTLRQAYPIERTSFVSNSCKKNRFYCFNLTWLTDVVEYYGQKFFEKMMNFIRDYAIEDLHTGNIGYIGAKPVLLDYSDWRDN